MAEIRVARVEQGHTKIRNVPIAVTPEGFWCCPSPVVFQKTPKHQNPLNNKPPSPPHSKTTTSHKMKQTDKKPSRSGILTPDDSRAPPCPQTTLPVTAAAAAERPVRPPKPEHLPRKVSIEFGDTGTSDMKVLLFGKQGFSVKLSVHRNVLVERSSFFAQKIFEDRDGSPCLQIDDCEDVEIYVETVGLMYCKDMKQRLIKQSVARVLRILKVAEILGFNECIHSCLEYLEAVPWVGEEEEEKVILSVLSLQGEGSSSSSSKSNIGPVSVSPVLNRVSSRIANPPPNDTLYQIIEMVLKSNEERSRREMKSIVLNLLKETSVQMCPQTLDNCCRNCLNSLLSLFRKAANPESETTSSDIDRDKKKIALEADNISWLLEILADRQGADEFAVVWAHQEELAALHAKLPALTRYHVSCITARLFVGIGRGQLLPLKETRVLLLNTWLQPLINDYRWLDHGCKSFDRKVVEEGIGRTILTLPLEEQQSMLLSWLASFLKAGDNNCPNLQRAFQVWWRRTFIRPYVEESHSTATATATTTLLDPPAEKLDGFPL